MKKTDQTNLPVREEIMRTVPRLRAYVHLMCSSSQRADEIVEEVLRQAFASPRTFETGIKIPVWMFEIAREILHEQAAEPRKTRERRKYPETAPPLAPDGAFETEEMRSALDHLSPDHLETLILTDACQLTYSAAGQICGCPIGTIRSRRHRAMGRVANALHLT